MIKPTGHFALLKVNKVSNKTEGGIILQEDTVKKETAVEQTGEVIAFGPTCFVGWKGCTDPDIPAYKQWGVDIGDIVEHRKYNAMPSTAFEDEKFEYRYVPDTDIMGVIEYE